MTRLVNGTQRCTGRLEVFHNGFWGKVCDTNWSTKEAAMVCKELSCGNPSKSTDTLDFGERSGQRGYTISTCTGNASSLAHCAFQETSASCKAVMISCSGKMLFATKLRQISKVQCMIFINLPATLTSRFSNNTACKWHEPMFGPSGGDA